MLQLNRRSLAVGVCAAGTALFGAQVEAHGLKMSLSARTDRIALWEALPVTVTLENEGNAPAGYTSGLFTRTAYGLLHVVRPDGSKLLISRPILTLLNYTQEDAPRVTLTPGERKAIEISISCDWETKNPIFVSLGSYSLYVSYQEGDLVTTSNEIRLEVVQPPAVEAEALRLLRSLPNPAVIYAPELNYAFQDERDTPLLEHLASIPGSRIYALYARLALGKGNLLLAESAKDPDKRLGHLDAARRWLDSIVVDGFTLAHEVAITRQKALSLHREMKKEGLASK